jgi:hypothetical protein
VTSTAKRWKKAQLQAQTTKDNSKTTESDSTIDETEMQVNGFIHAIVHRLG